MRYLHTMLRVRDVDASLGFYRDLLGLREVNRIENASGRFTLIFLAAPEDVDRARTDEAPLIELTYNWPAADGTVEDYAEGRSFGHLAFVTENVYALCERIAAAGIPINRPPRDGFMAFVRSPDGVSVELLQRGDALPSREPWASMANSGHW